MMMKQYNKNILINIITLNITIKKIEFMNILKFLYKRNILKT